MKLLIVAGGGGHFTPALAVIEKLPKYVAVMVVGRKYAFEGDDALSFEYQTTHKLGIPFAPITTGRLQRKVSSHSVHSLLKIPVGFFQSLTILKKYKPDVVLSFGGYVSVPVALAAKTLGIPVILHEQTFGAGLANKFVATFAKKVCISWKESKKFFPESKVVLTGNPIKNATDSHFPFTLPDEKLPVIYITGGSAGAHAINTLIEEGLETLLQNYILIHQTGDAKAFGDFDRLATKRKGLSLKLQKRYILTKFVDASDVFSVFKKADVVVSRSGINTVTELLFLGKPCLLIPLPYGQQNEQLTNAIFVKQLGLAELAEQKTLTAESLSNTLQKMIKNLDDYKKHSKAATETVTLDAVDKIIDLAVHGYKTKTITKP